MSWLCNELSCPNQGERGPVVADWRSLAEVGNPFQNGVAEGLRPHRWGILQKILGAIKTEFVKGTVETSFACDDSLGDKQKRRALFQGHDSGFCRCMGEQTERKARRSKFRDANAVFQ